MRFKRFRKLTAALLTGIMLFGFCACESGETEEKEKFGALTYSDEIVRTDDGAAIVCGEESRFGFYKVGNAYGVKITSLAPGREGEVTWHNDAPAYIAVNEGMLVEGDEKPYEAGYLGLYKGEKGVLGYAVITTDSGSEFAVFDDYYVRDGCVVVNREVKVKKASGTDGGFYSRFSMLSGIESEDYSLGEYFAPGIWYKDNSYMVDGAIATTYNNKMIMIRETRMGLPLIMMRNKANGDVLSICHYNPTVESTVNEKESDTWDIGDGYRYGSLGIIRGERLTVAFNYPCLEYPTTYNLGTSVRRFHTVKEGNAHSYSLSLHFTNTEETGEGEGFNAAMTETWEKHFSMQEQVVADVDLEHLYDVSVTDLEELVLSQYNGDAGVPFSVYLENNIVGDYSYQMGFIGQQIAIGYHLMRYGYAKGLNSFVEKGRKIVDMWAKKAPTESGVLKVWYSAEYAGVISGRFASYPSYLRIMADGMEGMLDAYRLCASRGEDNAKWLDAITGFANFLVNRQNPDGSYFRAYNYSGDVFSVGDDGIEGSASEQYDTKLCTPIVIRFLVKMYEFTGNEAYKNAAIRAGEYTLENIYVLGKYVGGTPDNINTVDREAGAFALYGYNALYQATGDEKWLKAAEQAAAFTMSWVYCYKFSCLNVDGTMVGAALSNRLMDGLSIIATGHSGTDNFAAYFYYEFFKLYVFTGNEYFLDAANFLQNNCRQTVNLDFRWGYKYESFIAEAVNIANQYVFAVGNGVWLPWCTVANIEPYVNMLQTFGTGDVTTAADLGLGELQSKLDSYGTGGKAYPDIV
ncbi:MAG: hypothetical protein ACI4S9_02250 [Christensenellales bacterium]